MQFHEKNFLILFDFTSFFAWTFLNFLARCVFFGMFYKDILLIFSTHAGVLAFSFAKISFAKKILCKNTKSKKMSILGELLSRLVVYSTICKNWKP